MFATNPQERTSFKTIEVKTLLIEYVPNITVVSYTQ